MLDLLIRNAFRADVAVADRIDANGLHLSTGLYYPPGIYARTDEVIDLARVVSRAGEVIRSCASLC